MFGYIFNFKLFCSKKISSFFKPFAGVRYGGLLKLVVLALVFKLQKFYTLVVSNVIFSYILKNFLKKSWVVRFIDITKDDDLQEIFVFVSLFYDFMVFYWAIVTHISIEVGQFG